MLSRWRDFKTVQLSQLYVDSVARWLEIGGYYIFKMAQLKKLDCIMSIATA